MKKSTSKIAIMAAMTVFMATGLFAQAVPENEAPAPVFEIPAPELENIQTIAVSVKVVTKKDVTNIQLKLNNGKIYIADAFGPDGEKAIDSLLKRNGKKAVVSGVLNEKTGVFNIIKLGNMNNNTNGDEK